jgi:transmembrane sensor
VWAAAAIIACVVGGAGLYLYAQTNLNYETGIGEQRFVKLVDGSTMELNSRSRVRIRYSSLERDVDLIEGQALFHVAKDSARPFIVHSGSILVRAVGTQFDVYRKSSGTTITVVEGLVAVLSPILKVEHEGGESGSATPPEASIRARMKGAESRAPADTASRRKPEGSVVLDAALSNAPNAIYLSAGEQITVSAQAQASPTHADPTVATAWTQHELVFDSTSLIEVAQDFNRYNTRQLIVNDAALRDFHITGVFSSADPASLLKFLRAQRDIIVEETDDGIRVSKK